MKDKEEKVKNRKNTGEIVGKIMALMIAFFMIFSVAISVIYYFMG